MIKKNKSIFRITLTSMLAVICLILIPMFGYLFTINLPEHLNQNAIDLLTKQTENRKNYLEDKLRQNYDLTDVSNQIDAAVQVLVDAGTLNLSKENWEDADSSALFQMIREDLFQMIRNIDATGIYVVLNTADMDNLENGAALQSIYIRELDSSNAVRSTEILSGSKEADSIVYPAFQAAYQADIRGMESTYGHLAITEHELAGVTHSALMYSVPLVLPSGEVYGVLGVEILEAYLDSMLPELELENEGEGIYFLAYAESQDESEDALLQIAFASRSKSLLEDNIAINQTDSQVILGKEEYYIVPKQLSQQRQTMRFTEEEWFLIGAVPTKQLFSFSNEINTYLKVLFVMSIVFGICGGIVVSMRLAHPIQQMYLDLKKARNQPDKIPTFTPTKIRELEEFSSAITNLSRDIIDNSAKFSRIIQMTRMRMAAYEIRYDMDTVYVTDDFFELLQMKAYDTQELTVEKFHDLLLEVDRKYMHSDSVAEGKLYCITEENGSQRYLHMKKAFYQYAEVGVIEDETESVLDKIQISHDRDFDTLTNIYNRHAVQNKFKAVCNEPELIKCAAAIMMDLDNLKYINDTYGHDHGDRYIQIAAKCIDNSLNALYGKVIYGRISGDEFFAFLYGFDSKAEVMEIVNHLIDETGKQCMQLPDGTTKKISISGGIAWYGEPATTADSIKKYADIAMYQMKKTGKGRFGEYQPEE